MNRPTPPGNQFQWAGVNLNRTDTILWAANGILGGDVAHVYGGHRQLECGSELEQLRNAPHKKTEPKLSRGGRAQLTRVEAPD